MESILTGIEDAHIYIDFIGAFLMDQNHHVQLLAQIFHCLFVNGFTVDRLKCE